MTQMATNLISLTGVAPTSNPRLIFPPSPLARSYSLPASLRLRRRRRLGEAVVVRSGPPSTTSLIIAFVLPLSLLAGTILTSIRISDNLDEQYLEELAMNEAMMEEIEGGGSADENPANMDRGGPVLLPEEAAAAVPRARNRPRREA